MVFVDPLTAIRELDISPGMNVADLGAGTGHYALEAARRVGEGGRVFAVDIQRELLARLAREAEADNLRLTTVVGNIERPRGTTMRDSSIDAAVLSNVLFQLERKLHALEEAHRILKPRGRLLVVEWSGNHAGFGPPLERLIREGDARDLLHECGFAVERRISAGPAQYGLIVCKR